MPLSEILFYAREFAWIPIVLVFLVLPYLYCVLAIDVHKEYAELVKSAPESFVFTDATIGEIQDDLHIFDLDWWLIAAIAALFVGLFSLGTLASKSASLPSPLDAANSVSTSVSAHEGAKSFACTSGGGAAAAQCNERAVVNSMLVGYATLVGLLLSFLLMWGKVRAVRRLRTYYLKFRLSPILEEV